MATSNFWYIIKNDMKSDTAGVSGSSQINDDSVPVSNVVDDIVSRSWRSGNDQGYFRIWIGGTNQNDYVDWSDGSTRVVQLTRGEYTASDLATHIQTRIQTLTADVTVVYSESTNKFTFAKPSGTLSLNTNNGANIENSIWDDIGFDTSANHTGALSYESENKAMHMEEFVTIHFGTLTIRNSTTTVNSVAQNRNDKLNFKESSAGDELTATIPPKDYSIHELMREIEYQMELVGDNDYEILYDEKTKKISITTDGDYLDLLWETGTNGYDNSQECWYLGLLIGLDDTTPSGSSDSTGSTSYTMDFPTFPNFSQQTITLGTVHGHTLSTNATMEMYFRNTFDRFLFDNSLESINNPDDVLTFSGDFSSSLVDEHNKGYSDRIGVGSIISTEVFGNPTIVVGFVKISPTSILSDENFGNLNIKLFILPTDISSSESVDNPTITINSIIRPNSIPTGEAVGNPTVTGGA